MKPPALVTYVSGFPTLVALQIAGRLVFVKFAAIIILTFLAGTHMWQKILWPKILIQKVLALGHSAIR